MTVGLYGDSYGCASLGRGSKLGMKYHWSNLLKNELDVDIVNYSVSGSSIYYCYKEFLKTHHLHDKIIFLISSPHRYIKSIDLKSLGGIQNVITLIHLENVRFHSNYTISSEDNQTLDNLAGWYKMSDKTHDLDLGKLMIDNIQRLRPDVFVVVEQVILHERDSFAFDGLGNKYFWQI